MFRNKKGVGGITKMVLGISIGLTVLYLLMATIVLPRFNESYNTAVTGLSASTTQGLLLLPLVLGLLAAGIAFFKMKSI